MSKEKLSLFASLIFIIGKRYTLLQVSLHSKGGEEMKMIDVNVKGAGLVPQFGSAAAVMKYCLHKVLHGKSLIDNPTLCLPGYLRANERRNKSCVIMGR
jgi:hypothetical protein